MNLSWSITQIIIPKYFALHFFSLAVLLAFIQLKPIVELQEANDLPIMSADKINDKACAELADIISEDVKDSCFINQS